MVKYNSILGFPGWVRIQSTHWPTRYRNLKTGQEYLFHPQVMIGANLAYKQAQLKIKPLSKRG